MITYFVLEVCIILRKHNKEYHYVTTNPIERFQTDPRNKVLKLKNQLGQSYQTCEILGADVYLLLHPHPAFHRTKKGRATTDTTPLPTTTRCNGLHGQVPPRTTSRSLSPSLLSMTTPTPRTSSQ